MCSAHKLLKETVLFLVVLFGIAAPGRAQFKLTVSSTTVNLTDTSARSIQVTTTNTAALAYTVSGVPFWLSTFSANNHTTPDTLSFQVTNTNCGTCTATILLVPATPPGILAPVFATDITVTYTPGAGGATLVATPSSLTFNSASAQPAASQTVTLSTTSPSAFTIVGIMPDLSWLSASVTSGSFQVSAASPVTLAVSAIAGALAPGVYTGHITINTSAGALTVITVTFNVGMGSAGTITASQTSFQLAYPNPLQAFVTIGSSNPAVTSFNVTIASQSNWLLFQNVSGSFTSVELGLFGITVNQAVAATLATGTYLGTITLINPQNVNDTTTISLTLTVNNGTGTGAIAAPASLAFTDQIAAANYQPQQLITVGPVGTFTARASVSSTQQWLVANASGAGPNNVVVTVIPQGLAAGTYTGTVTITSTSGTMAIPVTLTVTASAVVVPAPGSVNFPYQAPSQSPVQTAVQLIASDNSAMPVTASTSTPWITVGAYPATTPVYFPLTINPAGLCNGLNTGSITVSAPTAANSGFTIPVVVLVSGSTVTAGCPNGAGGPLVLEPPAMLFVAPINGPLPPAQNLAVIAPALSAAYTVSTSVPGTVTNWLTVQPSGVLVGSQTLVVSVNQTGLAPGAYIGTISLNSNGAVQTVPVTLVVNVPAVGNIAANPSTLTFSADSGQSAGSQNVTLSTTSPSPITISGVTTDSPNFLSAALTSGSSVSSTSPATLTVSATAARLPFGTITGHITVTPSTGSPITITVTFNVGTGIRTGTVVAGPPSLLFVAPSGQGAPTMTVVLTTSIASPVSITVVADESWLSFAVTSLTVSSTSPATLFVNASAANLPSGFYIGHLTINPSVGNVTVIPVTFPVPPPPEGGGPNLALGKLATQSSTLTGSPNAGAAAAVDGNPDGNFFDGSVTATNLDPNAWWQVDLGASATVNSIVVWNRTDCCGSRLNDFWVFVSDTPFLPTDTPSTLAVRASTFSSHQITAPSPSTTIVSGAQGRYVRVQLTGANYLSLAEVQVFGTGAPATSNLALGKAATESSTLPGSPTAIAAAAVDGSTDGYFFDGSVTATNLDPNPWWQVDLGVSAAVNSIVIWNRTDCCGSRLNDYWVFVSDTPFLPTDTPSTLQFRAGTFTSHQTTAPNLSTTIPAAAQGRYVRVQLTGANYLSLAEVQVLGTAQAITNLAQGKAAIQSSTLTGSATSVASAAVDGNTDGSFFDGSVTATNLDSNAWWQVDLGTSAAVSSVVVWNRTDCCGARLSDYWVFISDTPFLPTGTPSTLQFRPGTFGSHQTTAPNPAATIPAVAQGRYVRVQLTGANYLSLAEVQVFGQ